MTRTRCVLLEELSGCCLTEALQISTCTGLSAVSQANTKYAKGYAATGVGGVICSRHEFMLPNGLADILAGERCVRLVLARPPVLILVV